MMILTLRYTNNMSSTQFVVSDQVAKDLFYAMTACEEDPSLSDLITVVDEATKREHGHPGSVAKVRLRALCHARMTPVSVNESGEV